MNQQMIVCPKCGTLAPQNSLFCQKCYYGFTPEQRNVPNSQQMPQVMIQGSNSYPVSLHSENFKSDHIRIIFPLVIAVLTFILILSAFKLPIVKLSDNHTFNSRYSSRPLTYSIELTSIRFGEKAELYNDLYYINESGDRVILDSDDYKDSDYHLISNYKNSLEGAEIPLTVVLLFVIMLSIFTSVFSFTKHSILAVISALINIGIIFLALIPPEMAFCKTTSNSIYNISVKYEAGGILIIILIVVTAFIAIADLVVNLILKHLKYSNQ